MVTDHAHLIALNRFTGALLWDSALADWRKNYAASSAPLAGGRPGDLGRGRRRARRQRLRRRLRSGDRQGGLAVLDRAEARRAGLGDVEGQGHRARRRADVVHGQLRSRRSTWSTGRPATRPRSTTAPTARATTSTPPASSPSIARPARCKLALPVHAARPVGLGRDADVGARRRRLGGPAAPADAARQPQRLLLRVRSRDRRAAAVDAVREAPDVGERHRRRRASDQAAQPEAVTAGHEGVPVAGRRHQLVLAVVHPADRPLLRADVREVQRLHHAAAGPVGAASPTSAGRSASASRPDAAADPARARHPHRQDRLGAAAARPGQLVGRHADDRDRARVRRPRRAAR